MPNNEGMSVADNPNIGGPVEIGDPVHVNDPIEYVDTEVNPGQITGDPHAGNQDPIDVTNGDDITEEKTPFQEVVGKIDRLINIVKQKSQPDWDAHNLHWSGGGKTIDLHWEGKTILNAFEKMIDGKAHLVVIYEDMNGIDAVIY